MFWPEPAMNIIRFLYAHPLRWLSCCMPPAASIQPHFERRPLNALMTTGAAVETLHWALPCITVWGLSQPCCIHVSCQLSI